jgi:nitrate reductase gamma subunit
MLEQLTLLARGPLLKLSLLVMAAGLLRVVFLQVWELGSAYGRAGDQVVSWPVIVKRSLEWLLPWRYWGREARRGYNLISFVFHVGIIAVPVCLAGHVAIWEHDLGIRWFTLPPLVGDVLTVLTVLAIVGLLIGRGVNTGSRALSKAQDWLIPLLCLLPLLTGFLVAHPRFSPIDSQVIYLLHMLSAELLLILVPFTKLVHIVLFWSNRTSSEFGWRFAPGAGQRVRATLGKEGQGV